MWRNAVDLGARWPSKSVNWGDPGKSARVQQDRDRSGDGEKHRTAPTLGKVERWGTYVLAHRSLQRGEQWEISNQEAHRDT